MIKKWKSQQNLRQQGKINTLDYTNKDGTGVLKILIHVAKWKTTRQEVNYLEQEEKHDYKIKPDDNYKDETDVKMCNLMCLLRNDTFLSVSVCLFFPLTAVVVLENVNTYLGKIKKKDVYV